MLSFVGLVVCLCCWVLHSFTLLLRAGCFGVGIRRVLLANIGVYLGIGLGLFTWLRLTAGLFGLFV